MLAQYSITEMDHKDSMTQVYRDMVLWADIVLLATPIRWEMLRPCIIKWQNDLTQFKIKLP
jgi:multimeric flavodoxin WrbA